MSRKRNFEPNVSIPLSGPVLKKFRKEFDTPVNLIIRNALAQGNIEDVVTDIDAASTINHIFVQTLKKKGVKAVCQGYSGRCWMFAGLNMFRHQIIDFFDLKDFEFSGTYLYFWDKVERSNRFLDDILSTLDVNIPNSELSTNRREHFLITRLKTPISDGGDWGTFANLVAKYGLVPKSAMPERTNSYFSDQFNQILNSILRSHAYYLRTNYRKMNSVQLLDYKNNTIHQIYDVCVKFLGKPPEKFDWSIQRSEEETNVRIIDWTPQKFSNIIFKEIPIDQFIVISNYPVYRYHCLYDYEHNTNITIDPNPLNPDKKVNNGKDIRDGNGNGNGNGDGNGNGNGNGDGKGIERRYTQFLNLPIRDLEKYAYRSIKMGLPVWFSCDVKQELHQRTSSFSKDVIKYDSVFGEIPAVNKETRNRYQISFPNHAMSFIGADVKNNQDIPYIWQVENSWGYWDRETPGEDGFYLMTDSWFRDHVYQIVIPSRLLEIKDFQLLNTKHSIIPFSSIVI